MTTIYEDIKAYYEKALILSEATLEQVKLGKITDSNEQALEKHIQAIKHKLSTIGG